MLTCFSTSRSPKLGVQKGADPPFGETPCHVRARLRSGTSPLPANLCCPSPRCSYELTWPAVSLPPAVWREIVQPRGPCVNFDLASSEIIPYSLGSLGQKETHPHRKDCKSSLFLASVLFFWFGKFFATRRVVKKCVSQEVSRLRLWRVAQGQVLSRVASSGLPAELSWPWVKNRYPQWNPGKWNHGLKAAVQFLVV